HPGRAPRLHLEHPGHAGQHHADEDPKPLLRRRRQGGPAPAQGRAVLVERPEPRQSAPGTAPALVPPRLSRAPWRGGSIYTRVSSMTPDDTEDTAFTLIVVALAFL